MLGTIFPQHTLPRYHDDMLIVRVRHSTKHGRAHGLEMLAGHLRTGRIRYLHSLDTQVHPLTEHHTGSILVHLRDARHRRPLHQALKRDPRVMSVSRVPARYVWKGTGAGELPALRMWNHASIKLHEARELPGFREPRKITVAVIDSGVDMRHPDLYRRVRRQVTSYGKSHPHIVSDQDIVGHGTHVSGIIAANAGNDIGIDGMCVCDLTVFKVFTDVTAFEPAPGTRLFMVDPVLYRWALGECLHQGFDVVNLSLGGPAPPDPHEAALLKGLGARGSIVVAAMGNATRDRDQKSYPAAVPGVIAVGAIGPYDAEAPFSRRGRHMSVCAPGVAIWSTLPTYDGQFGFQKSGGRENPLQRNTRYDAWPGTSMATPHVTAAVAMLLARRGKMSPAKVRARLMRTADKVPGMRGKAFSKTYGAGRLNVRRLLAN